MFVRHIKTAKKHKVYDVTYDCNGHPIFLIYDGVWSRVNAKDFVPYEEISMRDIIRASEEAKML